MESRWAELPPEAVDHLGNMGKSSEGDTKIGRVMLTVQFILASGDAEAFTYAHLYKMFMKGNQRIELTFSDHVVVIEGRNLAELFRKLGDHRKARVAVSDRPDMQPDGQEVVEAITVGERK